MKGRKARLEMVYGKVGSLVIWIVSDRLVTVPDGI